MCFSHSELSGLMVSGDLCLRLGTRFTSAPRALSSGTHSHQGHDLLMVDQWWAAGVHMTKPKHTS